MLSYGTQSSGAITLKDSDGNTLAEYTPEKAYNCVVVSCPALQKGNSYTLTACGKTTNRADGK